MMDPQTVLCRNRTTRLLRAALLAAMPLTVLAASPTIAQPQTAAAPRTAASPGTEAALRHQIEGWEAKQPALDGLAPPLAAATQQRQAATQKMIDDWGALKSINFKGVNLQGLDVYAVSFANAQTTWSVPPLTPDGKIPGLLFGPAVARDSADKASPGTEAALRRHVGGLQDGKPAYDIMTPGRADFTRQTLTRTMQDNMALGAVKSVTFQRVSPEGYDIYEIAYENGQATWQIAPLTDGKIGIVIGGPPRVDAANADAASAAADPVKAYIARTAAAQKIISDGLVTSHAAALFNDAGTAVMGNPKGDVTIVEFFDYNCPFSRAVEPRVEALLKADPNVRLVLKEFTIEAVDSSPPAARAALASVKQGKYEAYHIAMMRTTGHTLSMQEVYDDAKLAGLDVDQLKKDMEAPAIYSQIIANFNLARALRIFQTPTFIIGGHIITDPSASIDFPKLVAAARVK